MAHPTRLGKYLIDGVLGSGAMGVVYEATDPMIQRRVALKTIQRSLIEGDVTGATIAARFRNEAQAAGRMSHPGIVSIYEYGEDGDTAFIAMEYAEGQDLARLLGANPTISEPMLLQIMDQLLSALHYAHERGVWHRDIKPANLILTQAGQLKITDFGIARIRDASITQVTSTIGTHGYMAPEQYRGEDFDHRVDIFASGVLLYRLLTGQPAFGGSPETIMYKVLHEDPPAASTVWRTPRTLQIDTVISKALAKDVRERYPTAAAFREALRLHAAKAAQHSPVIASALQDDATVVDPQALQFMHTVPQAPPAGVLATNWDADMLSSLERALASFVGPMARVMVKHAAARSSDFDALVQDVSAHLQTPEERARFLSKLARSGTGAGGSTGGSLGAGSVSGTARGPRTGGSGGLGLTTSPSGGSSGGASGAGPSAEQPLTPAFVAHATRVLASHMGPLAKVLVKRAEAQSATNQQLLALLVAQCADGVDRDVLRRELAQGLGAQPAN